MELRIDFPKLPGGKSLMDMRRELDEVLEDEKINPKYGIMAVKAYLQRAGFDKYTTMDLQGTKTRIFD